MLDGIILRLETDEEYRIALRKLEAWMKEDDRPAPPHYTLALRTQRM